MISVVLIEPENAGNVGAICRVMKNFALKSLVIVNPKCDVESGEAIARSKHAKDVLENAKVGGFEMLDGFDYLVGTTALIGSDYNIPRSPLMPFEFAKLVSDKNGKIGLLIGREGNGLTNEEIMRCDFIVTIPASPEYGTLNVSHACAVLFYELYKERGIKEMEERFEVASKVDKEQILKMVEDILSKMEFSTDDKADTQRKVWRRLVGKSMLTKREAFALMGFLRKML